MKRFTYRAMTLDGREVSGEGEAASPAALAEALAGAGQILIEAKASQAAGSWRALLAPQLNARQVTGFLSELAMLLHGGQRIDEALLLLVDGTKGGLAPVLRRLRADILTGAGLADAFAAQPAAFSPDVVALLRVAEATGRLDRAVEAAASQRARAQALTEKLAGALRYPLFLLVTAVGVLVFFLLFVIPQFTGIIRDAGGEPSGAIGLAIYLSEALQTHLDALEIGGILTGVAGLALSRMAGPRRRIVRALARLPVVAGILELRRTALFCLTLATLLGQGVTLPRALKVLAEVIGGEAAERLERVGDAVRRGASLGDALDAEGFLPPLARRMLRIGEESGELEAISAQAGRLFETKLARRLERVSAVIGPAAIVLIAGLIGGLMVTIMTALIDVNQMVL